MSRPHHLLAAASLAAATILGAGCSKPTPFHTTMVEAGKTFDQLQKLYEKKGPSGAVGYAIEVGKLLASEPITTSDYYKSSETFRDLNGEAIDELGSLENALVAGSDAQATGSIARIKQICQKCHDQKWSK